MLFEDNFVHSDLHPGNILIRFKQPTSSTTLAVPPTETPPVPPPSSPVVVSSPPSASSSLPSSASAAPSPPSPRLLPSSPHSIFSSLHSSFDSLLDTLGYIWWSQNHAFVLLPDRAPFLSRLIAHAALLTDQLMMGVGCMYTQLREKRRERKGRVRTDRKASFFAKTEPEDSFELVVLDCGLTASLRAKDRRNFVQLFRAVTTGDGILAGRKNNSSYIALSGSTPLDRCYAGTGQLMLENSRKQRCTDPDSFCREVAKLINQYHTNAPKAQHVNIYSRGISSAHITHTRGKHDRSQSHSCHTTSPPSLFPPPL